jgi:dCMP deaminase
MTDVMMQVAHLVSDRSTCVRAQVGTVITDKGLRQILSFGYNGNWAGGPNVCDGYEPGRCGCIHAEENALIKLSSAEMDLRLFTTTAPCLACAKRIINQQRIVQVYFMGEYRDPSGVDLLKKVGIEASLIHVIQ